MEDLNNAELRHLRTQTAISIYNEDSAVLEKVEDSCYIPQNAQDETRFKLLREILTSDPVIKAILKFLTVTRANAQTDC
jgi:hypothetical protein